MLGFDASTSGLLVVPYLGSSVLGALLSGMAARRLGRTKRVIVTGLSVCVASFVALTLLMAGTAVWPILLGSFVLGVGTGMTMPTTMMQVQNAAPRGDVGAATGSLLFLRSMGGAFGSTVVGTLLAMRFSAGLRAAGVTQDVDLGALRRGAEGLGALGSIGIEGARAALASGFQLGFGVCAGTMLLALGIAWVMPDLKLRSSTDLPKDIGH